MERRFGQCTNCGGGGHLFRDCHQPIMSMGIIATRTIEDELQVLMIQRKDSLGYVDILRGKYAVVDVEYITTLLGEMTTRELSAIQTRKFDELWNELWGAPLDSSPCGREYDIAKTKLEMLRTTCLAELIAPIPGWSTPEWGFPKGRRNARESDINCAMREFREETGLTSNQFTLISGVPSIEEVFIGSNKVTYKHLYFVAKCAANCVVQVDSTNTVQKREVGDIRWVSLKDGIALIRPYDVAKIRILQEFHI